MVHRVQAADQQQFRTSNVAVFSKQHENEAFDIIEAAEYGADALLIKEKYPGLPLVVKLHTPSFLTRRLNSNKLSLTARLRFIMGGIIRGKLVKLDTAYDKTTNPEYSQYCLAGSLCSPSASLIELVQQEWPTQKNIAVIPNPFVPDQSFLNLPVAEHKEGGIVVSFFGRLEKRKGILELAKAIPLVLEKNKSVIFRFVGKAHPSPIAGIDMEEYIKQALKKWVNNLEFKGYQPYDAVPALLAGTQVCIFPSLWENFPNVCLEAMAAGRAVIASERGGMAEMITHGVNGWLVNPKSPKDIASAIIDLAADPIKINALAKAARERVLDSYNEEKIGALVTACYEATIMDNKNVTPQLEAKGGII